MFELLIRNEEVASVAEGLVGAVLFRHDEDLEALPACRSEGGDGGVHVFIPVVFADDGVDFEFYAVVFTQLGEVSEFLQVVARAAAYLDISGFDKGVTRDGHDVDVLGVLGEPGGSDFAAVGDDGDGFQL